MIVPRKPKNEFLSTREAAEMLRLSVRTLENWRQRKQGPPFTRTTASLKIRGHYDFLSLMDWLEQFRIIPKNER